MCLLMDFLVCLCNLHVSTCVLNGLLEWASSRNGLQYVAGTRHVQGGENVQDAWHCRSLFEKEPLFTGLFCGKLPTQTRQSMNLRYPVLHYPLPNAIQTRHTYFICKRDASHVLDLQNRCFTRIWLQRRCFARDWFAKETCHTHLICKRESSLEFDLQKRHVTRIWIVKETLHMYLTCMETIHTYLSCKRDAHLTYLIFKIDASHVFDSQKDTDTYLVCKRDDSHVLDWRKRRVTRGWLMSCAICFMMRKVCTLCVWRR